ncbi:hypothetical protein emb_1d0708 [Coriobacteriaceae bacterium EMTCatB1]|nr:hypothetical protein emb_1d0708 [Coriobacteriaceae bacterium EMTCatB1]
MKASEPSPRDVARSPATGHKPLAIREVRPKGNAQSAKSFRG